MNPFRWSFRVSYTVGFLICVGLLAFALFAEHVLHMIPCPLCVFQRIAFMVMGMFFLVGAIHGPKGAGCWVYASGVILGGAGGIATAARHLWLQSLPADQVPMCGPDLGYMMDAFPFAKVLKMVFTGSGECAKLEPILGVPMPAWTLLWYVLLVALAVGAVVRRKVR